MNKPGHYLLTALAAVIAVTTSCTETPIAKTVDVFAQAYEKAYTSKNRARTMCRQTGKLSKLHEAIYEHEDPEWLEWKTWRRTVDTVEIGIIASACDDVGGDRFFAAKNFDPDDLYYELLVEAIESNYEGTRALVAIVHPEAK